MKVSKRKDPELWSLLSEKTLAGHLIALDLLTERGDEKGVEELKERIRLFEWLRMVCPDWGNGRRNLKYSGFYVWLEVHPDTQRKNEFIPYLGVRRIGNNWTDGVVHFQKNMIYEKIKKESYVFGMVDKLDRYINRIKK